MPAATQDDRPRVSELEIEASDAGQRIDNFLFRHLKGVPKGHIYRLLRQGQVRVNRRRARPDYRLATGDALRIPPIRLAARGEPAPVARGLRERLERSIVMEDDLLIVLDKPAGLAVHGGSGLSHGLIEALRQARPNAPFLELAHRLDKDTSGCLLVAKGRQVLRELHGLLRDGRIEKRYLALLAGRWQGGARRVEASLRREPEGGGARRVRASETGKHAVSRFTPRSRYAEATLVEVEIGTGRMHQIRVHAAEIGHPVAGDPKYGDFAFNRRMRAQGLKRMFLHASALRFALPSSGRRYDIEIPLEPDLLAVIEHLA
jgi:23S rRNA pseudouridine955/2504/2580 synthase